MALTNVDLDRIDGNSGTLANVNTSSINGGPLSGTRNRIINGDMRIDQRNAGASVTPADGAYTIDRWRAGASASSKFSVQQSTTAPSGFGFSMLCTSLSAYSVSTNDNFEMMQYIEGFNAADLAWGTVNAQTVTLSFWVRSSLTGTFGGAINNSAFNRSYPFSYTISVADTWEYKTITIAGDTSGTWVGATNGIGIVVCIGLGAGSGRSGTAGSWAGSTFYNATGATSVVATNGATLYITGVQLEAGSVATPFERRSYGQELALCQRYFQKWQLGSRDTRFFAERDAANNDFVGTCELITPMRVFPHTVTFGDDANWNVFRGATYTVDSRQFYNTTGSSGMTNVNRVGISITSAALAAALGGNWQIAPIRSNSNTLIPYALFSAEL
jgi:hypothetical protein